MAPLSKRLPRDLKNNLGKYLGIFVLMALATAFTSGFLASAASIDDILKGMRERYNVEDFYLTTMYEMDDDDIAAIEDYGCTVFENFSRDVAFEVPGDTRAMTVRLYRNRGEDIDQVVYAEGRAPEADGEIALDRVFCSNHRLEVGDTVQVVGEKFELVGIMTLSDYVVTYKSSGDFMFNAVTFTVAQISDEAYERLVGDASIFTYAVLLDDRAMDLPGRVSLEEDIVDMLVDRDVTVTNLIDAENNVGLTFAADDVKDDMGMWEVLMMVLVVVMAFVFVVLTDASIEQESAVIGTLLASGYRKRELIRHYMVLPTVIGLAGIICGNAIGLTALRGPMQALYYNSYSIPPYEYHFHPEVFAITSVLPFAVLVIITWLGLVRKLGATPLQFLRHEASRKARRGGPALPESLPYALRFRLRVFFRNASHFATLFVGILFGSLLLLLGLCMLPIVSYNAALMADDVPAEHLYVLKDRLVVDGTEEERRAWAAAWELTTDPAYDVLDLDLLDSLGDQLDELGIDYGQLSGDDAQVELPAEIEDAIEESIDHEVDPDDPVLLATVRMLAAAADIDLGDATDEQLARIIETADTFHRQMHRLDDEHLDGLEELLDDLMAVDGELEDPVNQTELTDAQLGQIEYFAMATLSVPRVRADRMEDVTVYGIQPGSRYWTDLDVEPGSVLVGEGLVEKCGLEPGVAATFTDRFTNDTYEITMADSCGNGTTMNVYMTLDDFNELFGNDEGFYNGIASDAELPLDERWVASEITPDKMMSMADQMEDSMGSVMTMIVWMVVPIYLVLIYLLTKTVIDRSARAISYMKVFGYRDREIDNLYIRAISVTVLVSLVACLPLVQRFIDWLVPVMLANYSGNFVIEYPAHLMAEIVGIGIVAYAVVAIVHVMRIRKVSLALAMKVQE